MRMKSEPQLVLRQVQFRADGYLYREDTNRSASPASTVSVTRSTGGNAGSLASALGLVLVL